MKIKPVTPESINEMAKRFCECGKRIVVLRHIRKKGKWRGSLKVFSDRRHTFCFRCHNQFREQIFQEILNFQGANLSLKSV